MLTGSQLSPSLSPLPLSLLLSLLPLLLSFSKRSVKFGLFTLQPYPYSLVLVLPLLVADAADLVIIVVVVDNEEEEAEDVVLSFVVASLAFDASAST